MDTIKEIEYNPENKRYTNGYFKQGSSKFKRLIQSFEYVICHYCNNLNKKEPLLVQKDNDKRVIRPEDGKRYYYHKSCEDKKGK